MTEKAADTTATCPQCKGTSRLLSPLKELPEGMAVYACSACSYTHKADGGAYVGDTEQLHDVFQAATLGKQTLDKTLGGENLNPATKAFLQAQIMEYGVQMWFDGLKQGLLLGAVQKEKGGKNGDG